MGPTEIPSQSHETIKIPIAYYEFGANFKDPKVGEVGELSEILQWKGEVPKGLPDWKEEEKQHLGEEFSDVLLYLVRLSDFYGVDLGKAALRKFNALETGSCSSSVVFPDDGNLVDRLTSGQYSD
ncbi:hypothetical protein ACFX2F_007509 [Malus domestica]